MCVCVCLRVCVCVCVCVCVYSYIGVSEESARAGGDRLDDGDGRRGRHDADEGGFGLGTSPADEQVRPGNYYVHRKFLFTWKLLWL